MWKRTAVCSLALAVCCLARAAENEAARQTTALNLGDGVTLELARIPAGTFMMGSSETELERRPNEVQHPATIHKPFYLGIHPVTQEQYEAVTGKNPSYFHPGYFQKEEDKAASRRRPVENVSWDDAVEFCEKLSEKTGRAVRLPTEAEWEYAARAGTTTPFHTGETISPDQANYNGEFVYGSGKRGVFRKMTTPVGMFPANDWGLHDKHGNVWEWCSDWYGGYTEDSVDDPGAVSGDSVYRVWRGGSWTDPPNRLRSAYRVNYLGPAFRSHNLGFRIALDPQ